VKKKQTEAMSIRRLLTPWKVSQIRTKQFDDERSKRQKLRDFGVKM
jgi:hypothetical protein